MSGINFQNKTFVAVTAATLQICGIVRAADPQPSQGHDPLPHLSLSMPPSAVDGVPYPDSQTYSETAEPFAASPVLSLSPQLPPRRTALGQFRLADFRERSIPERVLTLASEGATDEPSGAKGNASDVAKELSNPVANLISVPFQYNADFNAGVSSHAHRSYLNIQPVIPIKLNDEWSVITRTIIPVIYQEQLAPGQGTNWGLGDTNMSLFFTPREHFGGWIVGVGPVMLFPTGTDTALGGGKWGAGPTGLLLRQENGWTYGILASHTWSFAGRDGPDVNATFVQPFLSYQFPTATTVGLNFETTYDWTRRQSTVPANLSVSQVVKIGKMPVSFSLGGRYYAEGPTGGPEWGVRFVMTFVFPK